MKTSTTSTTEGLVETNRIELDAAWSQKGVYALGLLRRACLVFAYAAIWRWCLVHRPSWWPETLFHNSKLLNKRNINNNTFNFISKLSQFNLSP
jgi:hypothetical protein